MPDAPSPITALRRQRGMTQRDLADSISDELGLDQRDRISDRTVSSWERGVSRPRLESAQALERVLDAGGAILAWAGFAGTGEVGPFADLSQRVATLAGGMDELLDLVRAQAGLLRDHSEMLARLSKSVRARSEPRGSAARSRSS